jgi:integrase
MGNLSPNILKAGKVGKHSDGGGLFLVITGRGKDGSPKGFWCWRYTFQGKRREMGLGPVAYVTLKDARDMRNHWARWMRLNGKDPIEHRAAEEAEATRRNTGQTLNDIAPLAFEAIKATLKGEGNAGRWYSPVRLHILPKLGRMKVEEIHQRDIEEALKALWNTKHPTAKKALDRLSVILRHAAAMGLDVNPSSVIADARTLLGEPKHVVQHHPALPVDEVARLYQSLDSENNVDRALMLYLLIGGGARLRPLREARTDDIEGDVWLIDGEAMKGRKGKNKEPFRVPLSEEALTIVHKAQEDCTGGYLFSRLRTYDQSNGKNTVVSDQAIENIMRDREQKWGWAEPYRPHGIRAAFRSWAAQVNPHLYAIAEAAIAHKVGSGLERTYQRNDFLEERRTLMAAWANHLTGKIDSEKVIRFEKATGF